MKQLLRYCSAMILAFLLSNESQAQGIINMRFTNRIVSADGLHWTFDLEAQADVTYVGPSNFGWRAMNVRLDLTLPAGVTITGGSGVRNNDPGFDNLTTGNLSVQNSIIGGAPVGQTAMGVSLQRSASNDDLDATFKRLGTFTVDFSGPVSQGDPAAPRPVANQTGSSWTNISSPARRLIVFEDASFPLPVKLVSFTAIKENKQAQLAWTTSEETNSERFDVQRSQNGKSWETIAKVSAKGESKILVDYTAVDSKPLKGTNLYRLHMIDMDGTSSLSRIVSLEFDRESQVSVYPNPVADRLNIHGADFADVAQVQIFSVDGLEVYRSGLILDKSIDVKNLTAGMYVVKVTEKDNTFSSHRILVSK